MQSPPTYLDAHFYQNKNYANLDIEKRNNELDLDVPFEGVCNELRTGKGTGGWCGCFVGFPVINMPRMMPCVSTIPPKPSDRIHHRSFLSLSLSYPHQFPPRANLSPSPSLPFRFSSSPSPFMGIHRSHKKFDTFPVAWHGCVLDWASPRWCFPLPPSRNSRPRGEKRRLSLPRFASMDSHRNQGNWFFFTFIFIIPLPCYLWRMIVHSWITLSLLIIVAFESLLPETDDFFFLI